MYFLIFILEKMKLDYIIIKFYELIKIKAGIYNGKFRNMFELKYDEIFKNF